MKAEDFIDTAKVSLVTHDLSKQEADLRNAISRAYYAAYHVAKEVAKNLDLPVQTEATGSHEQLADRFVKCTDRSLRAEGDMLTRYRRDRNRADYELSLAVDPIEAAAHVEGCRKLIGRLRLKMIR